MGITRQGTCRTHLCWLLCWSTRTGTGQKGRGHCHSLALGSWTDKKVTMAAEAPTHYLTRRQLQSGSWTTRYKIIRTFCITLLSPESLLSLRAPTGVKGCIVRAWLRTVSNNVLTGHGKPGGTWGCQEAPLLQKMILCCPLLPHSPCRPATWPPGENAEALLQPLFGDQPRPPSRARGGR